mmetsp:Transcript_25674/g.55809  ORF Transcript_25674/g.55809 Transcript_25674/m.55809 type:complete len:220 (+) Transcript_25674:146-805(+)
MMLLVLLPMMLLLMLLLRLLLGLRPHQRQRRLLKRQLRRYKQHLTKHNRQRWQRLRKRRNHRVRRHRHLHCDSGQQILFALPPQCGLRTSLEWREDDGLGSPVSRLRAARRDNVNAECLQRGDAGCDMMDRTFCCCSPTSLGAVSTATLRAVVPLPILLTQRLHLSLRSRRSKLDVVKNIDVHRLIAGGRASASAAATRTLTLLALLACLLACLFRSSE